MICTIIVNCIIYFCFDSNGIILGKQYFKNYNGGHVMFMPNELYIPIGSEIAFKCDDGLVFSHDMNNNPIVYTICEPNGTMIRHGKINFWPTCVSRKVVSLFLQLVMICTFSFQLKISI